jgi:drug/metabolite transporter (DMT)-like permease
MQAMALWLVFLLAVGVSAWGQGAFLRFMPERALALCGVPLALLAADGWLRIRHRGGAWVAWWPRVVVGAGVISNAVAYLYFQGPLGQRPGEGAFAWTHSEMVWEEDLHLIDAIDAGTVLAPASPPPLLGDVVVHRRPSTRTVLGQPTLEFAGVNMLERIREVGAFFDPASLASGYDHRAAIDAWCVDYVLCPQTHPVDPRVLAHFRAQPWLEEVLGERDIALFRVRREATP